MPGAGNPQALNRYSYVLNNPLKYTDPSGHCDPDDCPEHYKRDDDGSAWWDLPEVPDDTHSKYFPDWWNDMFGEYSYLVGYHNTLPVNHQFSPPTNSWGHKVNLEASIDIDSPKKIGTLTLDKVIADAGGVFADTDGKVGIKVTTGKNKVSSHIISQEMKAEEEIAYLGADVVGLSISAQGTHIQLISDDLAFSITVNFSMDDQYHMVDMAAMYSVAQYGWKTILWAKSGEFFKGSAQPAPGYPLP